ncbi:MAG: hypothetical protein M1813_007755 [Trichoglossum hirsutum]|nr:MAG: hypothetical protein M1813_007755 [Trichoglossum hirsutum]
MATMQKPPSTQVVQEEADQPCAGHGDPANQVQRDAIRKGIPTLPTSLLSYLKVIRGKNRNATKARQGSTSNSTANSQQSPSVPISQQSSATSQIQRQPADQTPQEPPGITFPQQDSVIPVVTQQTILGRLRRCTLASTSKLMADEEAIFEDEHLKKLHDLNGYLDQNRAIWFHGMASRALSLTLVSITGIPIAEEVTYICIRGLRGEDEIARIHKKLSTKSSRKLYRPLRLCYDTTLITSASTEDIYEADMTGTQFTLCGTLVQTSHSGSRNLISTVGGLVEIDGKLFAITTSHHLQEDERSEDASSRSPDTSAEGETFDEDVEQALIVDNWKRHCDEDTALGSQLVYIPRDQESSSRPWTELGRSVAQGSDWRLLSVEDVLFRPNAILLPSEDIGAPQPSKTFQRGYEEGMSRRYLTSYDSPDSTPSKRGVHIIAGLSGICPGVLFRNVSYLRIGSSQSSIVWTVRLRPGIDLCQGDSGSWVVDAISNSVLGQLVAFSDDLAYLMPLHHVFSEIDQTMKPKRPVCLPSPFNILANLARHRYLTSEGVDDLAYRFASEALTDAVLEADSSNDIVKVIRKGHLHATESQTLTELLCLTGADVRSAFASPVQWVHSNATDIAKIKTDPTGRTAEYEILRLLHLLWRLDSTFSSSGIITPQPTRGSPAPEDNGLEITSSSLPGVVSKLEKSQSRPASLGPASRARGTQAGSGGLHGMPHLWP